MKTRRNFSAGAVAVVALLILGGCQSESPTAPKPTGSPTQTPSGPGATTVAVSVTNPTPVVTTASSNTSATTATITANVAQSGAAAPNGTAVEFSTTLGVFTDTGTSTTLRTTSGGVATASLTSSTAGTAVVTVRVNEARQTATVTFTDPNANQLVITGIAPATGSAKGGTTVTITGQNFQAPLRVLFGNVEAVIVSQSATSITVISPALTGPGTFSPTDVTVTVVSQSGTASEQRAAAGTRFRYQPDIVTPTVISVAPSSGPNEGNTRIVILGDGFQPGVRAFFGTAGSAGPLTDQTELEVLQVTPNQILALTPPALGLGAPLRNKQVTLRVLNTASNTEVIQALAFRYGPIAVITAAGPTEGSFLGGTRVTIDGQGFDDPVAVVIGGVAAQVIRVSGTQIIAVTSGVQPTSCSDITGPITVTNIEDGSTAAGPSFIYRVPRPTVIAPGTSAAGTTISVRVFNADPVGAARFAIGTKTVQSAFIGVDTSGASTFSVLVPSNLTFKEEACTVGGAAGMRFVTTDFDLTFSNRSTNCTDILTGGVSVAPPDPSCRLTPVAPTPGKTLISPASLNFGDQAVAAGPTASQTVTLRNTGGANVTVFSISSSDNIQFPITTPTFPVTIAPGGTQTVTFTVRFDPSSLGAKTGTITVQTDEATQPAPITATGNGV